MNKLLNYRLPLIYGKHMIVFKTCFTEPVPYNGAYYLREFSDVNKLEAEQIPMLFKNYYAR